MASVTINTIAGDSEVGAALGSVTAGSVTPSYLDLGLIDRIEIVARLGSVHTSGSLTGAEIIVIAPTDGAGVTEIVTPSVEVLSGLSVQPSPGITEVVAAAGITVEPGSPVVGRIYHYNAGWRGGFVRVWNPTTSTWDPKLIKFFNQNTGSWQLVPN